jgi:hypothetical protein
MGPYCKFCDNRCFVPTDKGDRIKSGLKATCDKGKAYDLLITIQEEGKEVARKVLNDDMGLAEAARFLAVLGEELEELKRPLSA